jgi:transcriptional regulator with XRE-family HTH domain
MDITEIKGRLRAAGRTQAELAKVLGVTESHVSNLLQGKKRMALDTFRRIERFLSEAERKAPARGVAETRAAYHPPPLLECLTLEEARKPRPVRRMSEEERELWYREIRELGEAGKGLPRVTDMTDDEILGYDEMP